MVINLHNCVGCGACGLACKAENNTQNSKNGTTFNWADFHTITEGQFPEVKYSNYPVLCNHCSDAPCIEACPLDDKAIFKSADGVTITNNERCIGCQSCVVACSYSSRSVTDDDVQYSILSFNKPDEVTHEFYESSAAFIPNCTSSPKEISQLAQSKPPFANNFEHEDYKFIRRSGVVEKCIFCEHRTKIGEKPYCVEACPTNARIFGDIEDVNSEVSILLNEYQAISFKNNKGEFLENGEIGTRPNVYYIRHEKEVVVGVPEKPVAMELIKVYPNPVRSNLTIEANLTKNERVSIVIYDFGGRVVKYVINDEFTPAGNHQFRTNVSDLQSGTYICRIQISDKSETKKIIVHR